VIQDYAFFTCVNILLAWSVYVALLGGNLSFAQGAFMAIGCYGAGVLTTRAGLPLALALPLAACLGAAVAAAIGLPALRVRGVYLILVTIGITFCVRVLIENTPFLGGVEGFGGMQGADIWTALTAVAVVGTLLALLSRSPLQRTLDAVREDDRVAAALGINVTYVKLLAFAAGAAIASVAGAIYGHYLVFVRADNFDIGVSVFIVLYMILGGVNNLLGPAVGATIMTLLPEYIRVLAEWRPTVFGLAIIVLLWFRPQGLLPFRLVTLRAGALRAGKGRADAGAGAPP
jgi:branched-chain amino acid transport system permease protein